MYESVVHNNGITILLNLILVKVPITDADSIRALACKILIVGLSRSENAREIMEQHPLFSSVLLQVQCRIIFFPVKGITILIVLVI